ncbi:MAG: TlpA family protein disulfide reductase [Candidatus Nanopelagicales bacterium]|nr:TlpA family protein disulfide reductase [Candidatus Nanopelagicales bacterium]MCF8551465.1 TlpA family protein disulfide reductase [Candidatus Nanopelagicales bacterium]
MRRLSRPRARFGGAALFLILSLSACSADPATDAGFVSGDGSVTILDPSERTPAPVISGVDLDGNSLSTADFPGDIIVLNVWASWCAPCRAEAPALEEVATEFAGQGVQLIGLNTRDSAASARNFVSKYGVSFPSIVDTDGRLQLRFNDTLPPQAIPSTIVLDQQGNVAARALGAVDASTLSGIIETIAQESVPANG